MTFPLGGVGVTSHNRFTPMLFTVDTTVVTGSASDRFEFNVGSYVSGTLTVDWGDGNTDDITSTGFVGHTYSVGGIKNIRFDTRDFIGQPMKFDAIGDRLKLLSIERWGNAIKWNTMDEGWQGCASLDFDTAPDKPDMTLVTNMFNAFRETAVIDASFLDNWGPAPLLTNMGQIFVLTPSVTTAPNLASLVGTSVTNLGLTMRGTKITSFDFDTSITWGQVTDYHQFFLDIRELATVTNFENIDGSNITTLAAMHGGGQALSVLTIIKLPTNLSNALLTMEDLANDNPNIVDVVNAELVDYSNFTAVGMDDFLEATASIPTTRYNAVLAKMVADGVSGLTIDMGSSTYSSGQPTTDRATLVTASCTITDGGQA